jgi:hypothetical protein
MVPRYELLTPLLLLALTACGPEAATGTEGATDHLARHEWTDPDSGCRYILLVNSMPYMREYAIAMAPKFRRDGKPDCPGAAS